MNALLGRVAAAVERLPGVALISLLIVTVALGGLASQQETDTDMTAFAPESDLAQAYERVQEEFGEAGSTVQIVVDAGDGGDVLSLEGLRATQELEQVVRGEPQVADALAPDAEQSPAIISFMLPVQAALAEMGADPNAIDEATLDQVVAGMLDDPAASAQLGALLSDDLDDRGTQARAGLVIVNLDADVPPAERADAELALRDALEGHGFDGFEVSPFSENIFAEQLLTDLEEEMPILLGLAFLLILTILFITFRRVGDVLLGLAGLLITIVWTYGISVLLGPNYLGLTGVMSQISIMIPVLLIGLAIDYAIHLTSRYREELADGATPPRAARGAVASVGGALVLATITTVVGFLTNLVSPLPPLRDFGLFVAGGVLSAFIVMLLLVPSVRSLVDRRRARKGTLKLVATGSDRGLGKVMTRAAMLAERRPGVTLTVAVLITAIAAGAGSQVRTTFDQDDFVPEDSDIGILLTTMQELFGGDLDETTNVLLEGDVATPEAVQAMFEAQSRLADTDNVRTTAGQPQVNSPATVLATLAGEPQLAEAMAGLGFGPEGLSPDADVPALYDLAWQAAPQLVAGVLSEDGTTARLSVASTAGQQGAVALRDALQDDVAALRDAGVETTVVSDFLLFEETLDSLTDSQSRGIVITLVVALLVLVAFFGIRERRPMLGVITMVPSALVVAWVAGSMWVLGLSFNVMTAMVASLAIGIGVPYGIHITNRFTEDLARAPSVDEAIRQTVVHTGGALVGSATTTAAGFGVLAFGSLVPIQQFGIITALTIVYSLIAAALVEPACLKLWATRERRRNGDRTAADRKPESLPA